MKPTRPSPSRARLPLELLVLIVEAVAQLERPHLTLAACAGTCHALSKRAQILLFRNVRISSMAQCVLFARTIDACPAKGSLVQSFSLPSFLSYAYDISYTEDLSLPPHVISRLTNLREAFLGGYQSNYEPGENPPIDLSSYKMFGTCPALTTLTLHDIPFRSRTDMIRFIWLFASLETLTLSHCWLSDVDDAYDAMDDLPDVKLYPSRCRNLTSLSLVRLEMDFDLSLPVWGTNVQFLKIDKFAHIRFCDRFAGLANFRALRHLELTLFEQQISWARIALQHVSSDSMRTIKVEHFALRQARSKTVLQFKRLGLDERLARLEGLLSVSWNLELCSSVAQTYTNVEGDILALVPATCRRGIFQVACKICD
ncbi:hypothetical protein C8Q76DRAFT_856423 [Earliella scabrosa]|nr:hypothetical protein C8Q76DRAFT_856423 [Earliella scabrosa]